MVALLAGALRGGAVETLLPGIHRLADVHSPVVDQGGLDHLVARSLEEVGYGGAEKIVAHVAEVKGFVGIRGREFHHYPASGRRQHTEIRVASNGLESLVPVELGEAEVEEALD